MRRKKPIELTLTDEARSELDAMAEEGECSRSEIVERLIRRKRKMPDRETSPKATDG